MWLATLLTLATSFAQAQTCGQLEGTYLAGTKRFYIVQDACYGISFELEGYASSTWKTDCIRRQTAPDEQVSFCWNGEVLERWTYIPTGLWHRPWQPKYKQLNYIRATDGAYIQKLIETDTWGNPVQESDEVEFPPQ